MSDGPGFLAQARGRMAARLAAYPAWVIRSHRVIIVVGLVLALIGGALASRLPLHTDFAWLLPDGQPSVVALRELTARKTSSAVIEIGVASPSAETTKKFATDLTAALRQKLPPDLLSEVDDDDGDVRRFVWDHRHLYAPKGELQSALEALEARMIKASPFDLGLDEEEPAVTEADKKKLDELRKKLAEVKSAYNRAPGYIGEDGRLRMLVLRCKFGDTEPDKGLETLQRVDAIVAELSPQSYDPKVEVGYCGDPVSASREHDIVLRDVVVSTVLCLLLVAGAMLVYFRALRGVLALCLTLGVGTAVTFGFTKLWIGHLNTSTAFLGSVVAGNGINFGIIFMARYFEERRRNGAGHEDALAIAIEQTVVPTLVGSAAAGAAYLSLTVTTFRGFSEFGIIAGSGMAFCWIASFVLLPALLTFLDRRAPLVKAASVAAAAPKGWVITPTRRIAAIAVGVVAITAGLSVRGAYQLYGNPFEDNLHVLRSQSYPTSNVGRWSARLDAAFGRDQAGGFYIGVEKPEDVSVVVASLRAVEKDTPAAKKQVGKIDAVSEVLPGSEAEQAEKIRILEKIAKLCERIAPRLAPDSEEAKLLADLRPPPAGELKPIGFADLPVRAKRAFTENDGRTGLLLAVHPGPGFDNATYTGLRRAVAVLRDIKLPESVRATARISGSEVIFVEMMDAVEHEGPRASILSFGLVLVLLFLAFGPRGGMALTTFALFVGVFGMFGLMSISGVRLNFLNYIAVPITIGIGVDYPFNIVARIRQEGWVASRGVVRTAGAVALCSLTTIIGYAVLLLSDTGAIRSFGAAAVLGEITTISAALVVVPAIVLIASLVRREPNEDVTAAGAGT
ncbi:MAG: MMPL family transporter [Minicystis sp.]